VWVSPDGGDVWNEVTGDLHDNDVVTLALDHLGQFLFAGNEGSGVHRLDVLCHADADCVDTNSCTADTCNPDDPTSDGFGCVHFQADPDCIDQCDNAADCQAGDLCSVWQCVPGDPDADPRGCVFTGDVQCANDACHEGFCDPDTGQCSSLPLTGVPCDDGDPCTTTDRCQAGVCVGAQEPVTACKASIVTGASTLSIRDASADTRDKLVFKFRKGPLAIPADFGDPFSAGGTGYATCLYDHSGPGGSSRLLASSRIDPAGTCNGRPCWSSKGVTLKYRNRAGQADGGIDTLQLLAGPDGHTRIALSAHGIALDAPAAPYTPAVTLQVRRTDTLTGCWGATFSTGIKLNGAAGFKGKSD